LSWKQKLEPLQNQDTEKENKWQKETEKIASVQQKKSWDCLS
jgi:hypothetical protein